MALVLLSLPFYGPLFSLDQAALGTDYGRIFLPPLLRAREALLDGELLLWDAQRYSGTPYWSLPNTAPAWPPLLAAMLVFGALGGLNFTVLGHLAFGALGSFRVARAAGADAFGAWLAAALFLHAPFTRLFAYELPFEAMALAFLPWVLLCVLRAAQGADWRVGAIAGGLLWAAVPWCGGYVAVLYGFLAFGTLALALALLPRPGGGGLRRRLLRAVGLLLVLALVFAAVGAGRLMPTAAWVELTDRAEAIGYEETLAGVLGPRELLSQLGREGWSVLALGALGVVASIQRRPLHQLGPSRLGDGLAFAALLALVVLLVLGLVHRPLYELVPGFDRIRDPRRAWVLVPGALPVLAGLGATYLRSALARTPLAAAVRWPGALASAVLLVALLGVDNARGWSRPKIESLSARLEANALHAELARRASDESAFRVLDAKDTRPKLKRTADLIRAGYRLQSVEGVIGNIRVRAYDDEFVSPGQVIGPRAWGFMNCRYVTSSEPLDERYLELEGTFEEDPEELCEGTDGPYLYRNRAELPRAFLADAAIALVDAGRAQARGMLASTAWNPRRVALVRAAARDFVAEHEELVGRFAAFVACNDNPATAELRGRAKELGMPWHLLPADGGASGDNWLLADGPERLTRLEDPTYGWRRATVDLGAVNAPSWLIVAETYAIYPGWRAEVDGVPAPLFVANGAATAVPIPAGASKVEFEYVPKGFAAGVAVSAASLAVSLVALARLLRGGAARTAGESTLLAP